MPRFVRLFLAVVVLAALLCTTAATAGASSATAKVKPAKWAQKVCTSVGSWVETIDRATDDAASGSFSNPKQAKKALTKLINRSLAASRKLLKQVKKAGTPKVPDGALVATTIQSGYEQVVTILKSAKKDFKATDPSDINAFRDSARAIEDSIESSMEHTQAAFNAATNADVPQLVEAFLAEPACEQLTA